MDEFFEIFGYKRIGAKNDMSYICSDCAKELGGVWPKDHMATFHEAVCDNCEKTKMLAHVDDWNWPNRRFRYTGNRD